MEVPQYSALAGLNAYSMLVVNEYCDRIRNFKMANEILRLVFDSSALTEYREWRAQ